MSEDNESKLDIDWLKTIAGALAAVSSAVLLSTLGAAGTLIGAALGSVIATVGGAVYAQGLASSKAQLARAQEAARLKVGVAQAEVKRASRRQGDDTAVEAHLAHAEDQLDQAKGELDSVETIAASPGWRERLVVLPWKRIALLAAGLFAAAVVAITGFELVAGESVSELTGGTDGDGGTTISRIGGGSEEDQEPEDEPPADEQVPPSDEPAPSEEPSEEPSESPSEELSEEPSDEPSSDPSVDSTPSPMLPTPTDAPTGSPPVD